MGDDSVPRPNVQLNRRTLLKYTAVGSTIPLAGCSSDSDSEDQPTDTPAGTEGSTDTNNDDEDEEDSGGTPIDSAFTTKVQTVPMDIQHNPYNPSNRSAETDQALFDPLVKLDRVNNEWIPVIFTDWSVEGDTLDITVSEEHTWHDGDPVTAHDVATQWKLDLELGQVLSDYVSSVTVNGDYSLTATLVSDTINLDLLYLYVFDSRLFVKEDIYADRLAALEEASTEEETDSAQQELLEWVISDPVGNGPFKVTDSDSQRLLTVKHEDYPGADEINFPEYEFRYLSSNQERWQALMSGVTDGESHLGISQEVLDQMPDSVELFRPPDKDGTSLQLQHEDTVFSDVRVRKAIAYVLRGDLLGQDSTLNYQFESAAMNTGMMPTHAANYLSDETVGQFTNYDVDRSTAEERATALLEEAGFSKSGGTWNKPNGDTFDLPVKTIGDWWSVQAQSLVSQLQEFGIEAEFQSQGLGTFFDDLGDGNFVAAINGFSGQHPAQTFRSVFEVGADSMNIAEELEVPMPIGDPDGSTETVNPGELLERLGNTRDDAEVQSIVEELAWTYNQTIPRIPYLIGTGMTFMTSDDWEYPNADSTSMNVFYPPYWLLRTGELKAKTE